MYKGTVERYNATDIMLTTHLHHHEPLEGHVLLELFRSHIALQTTFHLFDMPLKTMKIQLVKTRLIMNRQKDSEHKNKGSRISPNTMYHAQALYIHFYY